MLECNCYLSQKPRHQVSKYHGFVGLVVPGRGGDTGRVPEVRFPLVEESICTLGVYQDYPRGPLDQPTTVDNINASLFHRLDRRSKDWIRRGQSLYFHSRLEQLAVIPRIQCVTTYRFPIERPDEGISIAILCRGHRRLGLEDRVDTTHYAPSVEQSSTIFV